MKLLRPGVVQSEEGAGKLAAPASHCAAVKNQRNLFALETVKLPLTAANVWKQHFYARISPMNSVFFFSFY